MYVFGDARLPQRFWDKVFPEPNTGCWLWSGSTHKKTGYTYFQIGSGKSELGHRVSYAALVGPIANVVDHLCRFEGCVNPRHLEAVTQKVNVNRSPSANARKTHCPKGHPYTAGNLVPSRLSRGARVCTLCNRAISDRRYSRKIGRPLDHRERRAQKAAEWAAEDAERGL